jgi:hypothetical protein
VALANKLRHVLYKGPLLRESLSFPKIERRNGIPVPLSDGPSGPSPGFLGAAG